MRLIAVLMCCGQDKGYGPRIPSIEVCNDNVLRLPGHVTSSITVRPEN